MELTIPYLESFESFITLIGVFLASGWINQIVPNNKDLFGVIELRQLVSLVVSMAMAVLAMYLGDTIPGLTNFLADKTLIQALAYGLGGGLVANGMFKITIVKMLLAQVKAAEKPKT